MKIEVPTNINDITLAEYQRFALINTDTQDKEFFTFKTIEIFCGVDIAIVSKMAYEDATELSKDVLAVLDQTVPFTNRFTLNGIEYGFIPDLQAMSLGEFIDLEENLSDAKNFHKAAAVMFRPIVKSFKNLYTIEGYNADPEAIEAMKSAPMGIVAAAIVFFYGIANELVRDSQSYLAESAKMAQTTLEKPSFTQNTAGLTLSMLYAQVMLQGINKSQK